MSQTTRPVYLRCGVANYQPPRIWHEATAAGGESLNEKWHSGKLEQLYAESILWNGFERLIAEARSGGVELAHVRHINVAISYPRELAQMTEDEVVEDFKRRLAGSPHSRLFREPPNVRFTPTHAASASGMVPFNDALADILHRGDETSILITAANTKGTNRNRPRINAAEVTDIFASLISPFDRKFTGANMLKLGAAALGRVYQHNFDMIRALNKFSYDQRLYTHELARRNLSTAHVTRHPDEIEDRTIFYPLKLMAVAPQSMGYAGLVLSSQLPAADQAVRVVGLGCGVERSSIRDRKSHLFSAAMQSSVTTALNQAFIPGLRSLKILEHHNPFPAVPLTELEIILKSFGYKDKVSDALLSEDVGVKGKLIKAGRSGGAMSGHGITPTFVRLTFEAFKELLGEGGYPSIETENGVAYAGISSVGGHHTFDGYVFLAGSQTEAVAKLETGLESFDHDDCNGRVDLDLREQQSLDGADVPEGMTVAFISYRESRKGREYFGLARTPGGRDFNFSASAAFFERLLESPYIGTPIRITPTLQAIESESGF
jgi:hypothetical protein